VEKLIEEYIPISLRKEKPVMKRERQLGYSVCFEFNDGTFAKWAGPYPELGTALEVIPAAREEGFHFNDARIVRQNEDYSDDALYRWQDDKWILLDNWREE
jgi:hypothetical protein